MHIIFPSFYNLKFVIFYNFICILRYFRKLFIILKLHNIKFYAFTYGLLFQLINLLNKSVT